MSVSGGNDREKESFKLEKENDGTQMSSLSCVAWNVQSIRNKCSEIMEHILDHDANVVFFV